MHFPCVVAFTLFVVVLSTFGCEQLKVRRFTMCNFFSLSLDRYIIIMSVAQGGRG